MKRQLGEDTLDSPMWGAMGGWVIQTGMVPEREGPHNIQFLFMQLKGLLCIQLYPSSATLHLCYNVQLSPLLFCPPQLPQTTPNYSQLPLTTPTTPNP